MAPVQRASGMRATVLRASVLVLGATGLAVSPAVAQEQPGDDVVRRYHVAIDLDRDGTAHVTADLDVDFGTEPNHGPYLTYVVKQRFDDTQDRVYRVTDVRASSTTAPDAVELEEDGGLLSIRIGDEDRGDLTGVHSYRVTFDVEGWVNSAGSFDLEDDELYPNVVGGGWQVPLRDVAVTVTGPATVTDARCYSGADETCATTDVRGAGARFTEPTLAPGEPLTVAVAFPAGTFGGVAPIVQDRWSAGRAFALTPATGLLALLGTALGVGAVVRRVRTDGRDEDAGGGLHGAGTAAGGTAGTIRTTPPDGLRPGQLGTLLDEVAGTEDVTATLVDLAVRGHLTIAVVDDDWRLERSGAPTADLLPFELRLLDGLFDQRRSVLLSELPGTFAATLSAVRDLLHDDVTQRGWFRGNPSTARSRWAWRGTRVLLGGVLLTVALALWTSWALVGIPVVATGLAIVFTTGTAPSRTAAGSALLARTRAFRDHLAAVEADRLGDDAGDVLGRNLPYAIAFGLGERWTAVGRDAARSRGVADPTWYVGTSAGLWASGAFGEDVARFTSAAGTAMSGAGTGTSGSSGVSSGFAGGGVGGGGGGTW